MKFLNGKFKQGKAQSCLNLDSSLMFLVNKWIDLLYRKFSNGREMFEETVLVLGDI